MPYAFNEDKSRYDLTSLIDGGGKTTDASELTTGTLNADRLPVVPIAKGGTNANTATGALTNLGVNDYVVAEGTSDIWTYRKWNSGIAECWGSWTTESFNVASSWGNGWYYSPQIGTKTYPFNFTKAPLESVDAMLYTSGGLVSSALILASEDNTQSATRNYQMFRQGSSTGFTALIEYRIVGRWK